MSEANDLGIILDHEEQLSNRPQKSRLGLLIGGIIGGTALAITFVATPFVLPALRKYCLPYVPATDVQLRNLGIAFKKHAKSGSSFLDIGSGDGRICRLASEGQVFNQVHGVELNLPLVIFSRLYQLRPGSPRIRYFHKDLWKFPMHKYDSICIFGVQTMMDRLEECLLLSNNKSQTVFACRYPFKTLNKIDEIGSGIDTVWVYRIQHSTCNDIKQ